MQVRTSGAEPLRSLPAEEGVKFLLSAVQEPQAEPIICEFAKTPAMDRFFQQDLRPALETAEGPRTSSRVIFDRFRPDQAPADTALDALRELVPEAYALGVVDWMPLDVAVQLVIDSGAGKGRILVLSGSGEARKQGEREWQRILAALRKLASRAEVRVILGDAGREVGRGRLPSTPRSEASNQRGGEEDAFEREVFRTRSRLNWRFRGAHGIATAFVSGWLLGMGGIAISWISVSAWHAWSTEVARNPEAGAETQGTIAALSENVETGSADF